MRIALDGACLSSSMTGVGRYFHCLLEELIPMDTSNEYTLFLKEDFETHFDFPNLRIKVLAKQGSYFIWQNTLLRKAVAGGGFDLFWSPNYTLPFFLPTPSILTVHDISWKALPDNYSWANCLYRNFASNQGFKKAKIIFTDSDFSKAEITGRTAVPEEKVKRIHLGSAENFQRAGDSEIADFKARYGLGGKRLIGFLGSFFKRRHIPEIIAAQEILRKQHPDTVLFLVGDNYDSSILGNELKDPHILWLQRLPENEINAFYSSLSLFLYISEYEGFGLPPLEALNCGTVSLLLRRSSLAEIYGDFALFVDQPDPAVIAEAISGFLEQEEETKWQLLSRWQARKSYFSWKRAAEEYLLEIRKMQ